MVAVKPVTVAVPLVALAPVQPFEAVQPVAFVEDHVIVVESPLVTEVGDSEIETLGAVGGGVVGGGVVEPVMVTAAVLLADPPAPVQLRANVVFAVSAAEACEPEVALVPVHPFEAVHDVAFVEDHVSVVVAPLATDVGLAVSETVGAGVVGGGVAVPMATVTDCCAV